MVSIGRAVRVGLVPTAALTLSALILSAPAASAATTTIRAGSATGSPYSGNVQVTLLGSASVSTVFGTGTCNQGVLAASVQSNGTALNISSMSVTNSPGPDCPVTGSSATVTVTAQSLPWSGGTVTYAPVSGGQDATISLTATKVKTVTHNVPILGTVTCYYGGALTAAGYNPTNPSRPDATVSQAQGKISGATISKINSGSDAYCPATATVNANIKLIGQTTPGTFNQMLFVTS